MSAPLPPRLVLAHEWSTGAELVLPLKVVTAKNTVAGQSGGGKTFTMQLLAELMLAAGAQVVVLTPVPNWWALQLLADGVTPGFTNVIVFGGPRGELPLPATSGRAVAAAIVKERLDAVLDVSLLEERELALFVTDFATELLHLKMMEPGAVHLFLDEGQNFVPEQLESAAQAVMRGRVLRLLNEGRNYGLGWTLGTQSTQKVSKRALDQVEMLIVHRMISKAAAKPLRDWAADAAQSENDIALFDSLAKLETGEALVLSPTLLRVAGRYKIALKRTFDAGRTPDVGVSITAPRPKTTRDLEALRAALGSAASAQTDDPEALRRRVQELERELATVRSQPPAVVLSMEERIALQEAVASQWTLVDRLCDRLQATITTLGRADETLRASAAAGVSARPDAG